MPADPWTLYRWMLTSRLFEQEVAVLWRAGLVSGEMHLGTGEEGISAGVVTQLGEGDAMALDHRGTPPLLMRGANPVALLREILGREDGLSRGRGGHMHLFVPELLAASSGIVGATGPMAVGFALAAQHLRPGRVAVSFFGEAAMNEGALLESLNLAVAWRLPVLFVCKDNGWSITTYSPSMTGGRLVERARAFGMPAADVDGTDALAVHSLTEAMLPHLRQGNGPAFLLARCVHLDGHFLGDQLLAAARRPLRVLAPMAIPLSRAALSRHSAPLRDRSHALTDLLTRAGRSASAARSLPDPLDRTRRTLLAETERLRTMEAAVTAEVRALVDVALEETP